MSGIGSLVRIWIVGSGMWSALIVAESWKSPFTYSIDLPLVGTVLWNTTDQIIAGAVPWAAGAFLLAAYVLVQAYRFTQRR